MPALTPDLLKVRRGPHTPITATVVHRIPVSGSRRRRR